MPFRPSDLLMFKFVNRLWTSVVTSLVTFILTQFIKLKFTSGMGIFYTSLAETDIKNLYNFFAIFLSSFIPLSFDSSTTYMRSRTPARHLKIRLLLVAVSSHAAFSLFVYIIACPHLFWQNLSSLVFVSWFVSTFGQAFHFLQEALLVITSSLTLLVIFAGCLRDLVVPFLLSGLHFLYASIVVIKYNRRDGTPLSKTWILHSPQIIWSFPMQF